MNFYISDIHAWHENVLTFDNRPFANLDEMHSTIKSNWNNIVTNNDTVYILGDFLWKYTDESINWVKSLNGNKRLIKGNHDKCHDTKFKNLFQVITPYEEINDEGIRVVLCHYPISLYNGHYHKAIHLYGHVHGNKEYEITRYFKEYLKNQLIPCEMYNVGCMIDYMGYTPKTLKEIIGSQ